MPRNKKNIELPDNLPKKKGRSRKKKRSLIYLDNNTETFMTKSAKKVYGKWITDYDPTKKKDVEKQTEKVKKYIRTICESTDEDYDVVFTSGDEETHSFILRSVTESYKRLKKMIPHVIMSAVEDRSLIVCAEQLKNDNKIDLTIVLPNVYGCILPKSIEESIKPNTCLICCCYANKETGSINNVPKIGTISHKKGIPLYSDCASMFGRFTINLSVSNIDIMSGNFKTIHGPKNLGVLLISKELMDGYQLQPQIIGHKHDNLRGGSVNVAAIMSGYDALKSVYKGRQSKNKKLLKIRNIIIKKISEIIPMGDYVSYIYKQQPIVSPSTQLTDSNERFLKHKQTLQKVYTTPTVTSEDWVKGNPINNSRNRNILQLHNNPTQGSIQQYIDDDVMIQGGVENSNQRKFEFIVLGPPRDKPEFFLPNTLMVSFVKNRGEPFSNVTLQKDLQNNRVIVSVGYKENKHNSHILSSMKAPESVKNGAIRISLSDDTKLQEINSFCDILLSCLKKQIYIR